MDKRIRCNLKSQIRIGHVASERTSHLTSIFSQPVWEGKREKERERGRKEESLEREALLSL